ncbi:cation:proton antiporter [Aquisphaera insulae]|uniref:cation:proton antiporter n=1 Tax=Aquisphaera insulae TaxID=2712864 RepID=UPI0020303E3D|nr:cation:proton antiporter [Aquisphaera insulae]
MHSLEAPQLFAMLAVMLAGAKVMGAIAQKFGQPAVLGELISGLILGRSGLALVDMHHETMEMLMELGVFVLLLAIGLETELPKFFKAGKTSTVVAVAGVVLPFVLGYGACRLLGMVDIASIMAGATLTATSVGITARVLSDLGKLGSEEGQIILGAAVIDDVLGLVILTVVKGMAGGASPTLGSVAWTTAVAFGFLIVVILAGKLLMPWLLRAAGLIEMPGTPTILALILALALAWAADRAGSALILGAFAAGLLLNAVPRAHEIEHGVTVLGHFFVPIFFVGVGASVDLHYLDPRLADGRWALLIGGVLIFVGIFGKLFAGYAPYWFKGRKSIIGVGMIPRGEVGLIFGQMGMTAGIFDESLFAGVTLMVLVTTFLAPPLLKRLVGSHRGGELPDSADGIEDLVMEA